MVTVVVAPIVVMYPLQFPVLLTVTDWVLSIVADPEDQYIRSRAVPLSQPKDGFAPPFAVAKKTIVGVNPGANENVGLAPVQVMPDTSPDAYVPPLGAAQVRFPLASIAVAKLFAEQSVGFDASAVAVEELPVKVPVIPPVASSVVNLPFPGAT